jgi:8-oxo-dGTP pyrophosphatase MutT (NUDIX family)
MSFADHIRFCNSYDPARVLPLVVRGERVGLVRRDNAALLRRFADLFAVDENAVRLAVQGDAEALSAAVDGAVKVLAAEHRVPRWRNETFDVMPRWGMAPLFRLDRGAVPFFGTRAYGVHLNGYRRAGADVMLWVGRRSPDKEVAPNKLDNLVAGGIGNGHGVTDTLVKEGEEEAGILPELIARAVPVGAVSYRMETALGIRDDVLFCYDLEVPADFVPQSHDGEIVEFTLMPAAAVLDIVRRGDDFKFNVNLVILDFALRHGLIRPDDPEYLDIASGLHRPLD